ncbi:MAG: glycosyl hydrolase family 28 protein, partial [Limisphaerales bacterium]
HGMSIGSETDGGVRNVTVKNCTFENTENGLRIKSNPGKGGLVENISYSDIRMTNVDPAITFTCFYMNNSAKDAGKPAAPKQKIKPSDAGKIPLYRDITISNLTAVCERSAGVILGLPDNCISNVVFENVKISAKTGLAIHNAKGIRFKNSAISVKSGPAFTAENAEVEGLKNAD